MAKVKLNRLYDVVCAELSRQLNVDEATVRERIVMTVLSPRSIMIADTRVPGEPLDLDRLNMERLTEDVA